MPSIQQAAYWLCEPPSTGVCLPAVSNGKMQHTQEHTEDRHSRCTKSECGCYSQCQCPGSWQVWCGGGVQCVEFFMPTPEEAETLLETSFSLFLLLLCSASASLKGERGGVTPPPDVTLCSPHPPSPSTLRPPLCPASLLSHPISTGPVKRPLILH